ncbi:hypothetical protein AYI70_g2910 [Smittium culicis]|uniref:Uncharacterized protein n=1 Tax=Smittium culicis TaxID=133412 RepID=A0A1R1Y6E2_9FUNG|nr:hypothetical protein AYI70_g9760 [Smittium culicis]OMJ17001.1 hypothetical protein AYI70_g6253 [Smittium culicis]OMJ22375.1 hypothetical protein AYI70_g2910 [Smittium culicis]
MNLKNPFLAGRQWSSWAYIYAIITLLLSLFISISSFIIHSKATSNFDLADSSFLSFQKTILLKISSVISFSFAFLQLYIITSSFIVLKLKTLILGYANLALDILSFFYFISSLLFSLNSNSRAISSISSLDPKIDYENNERSLILKLGIISTVIYFFLGPLFKSYILTYKLSSTFGWLTYRAIGANLKLRKSYFIQQLTQSSILLSFAFISVFASHLLIIGYVFYTPDPPSLVISPPSSVFIPVAFAFFAIAILLLCSLFSLNQEMKWLQYACIAVFIPIFTICCPLALYKISSIQRKSDKNLPSNAAYLYSFGSFTILSGIFLSVMCILSLKTLGIGLRNQLLEVQILERNQVDLEEMSHSKLDLTQIEIDNQSNASTSLSKSSEKINAPNLNQKLLNLIPPSINNPIKSLNSPYTPNDKSYLNESISKNFNRKSTSSTLSSIQSSLLYSSSVHKTDMMLPLNFDSHSRKNSHNENSISTFNIFNSKNLHNKSSFTPDNPEHNKHFVNVFRKFSSPMPSIAGIYNINSPDFSNTSFGSLQKPFDVLSADFSKLSFLNSTTFSRFNKSNPNDTQLSELNTSSSNPVPHTNTRKTADYSKPSLSATASDSPKSPLTDIPDTSMTMDSTSTSVRDSGVLASFKLSKKVSPQLIPYEVSSSNNLPQELNSHYLATKNRILTSKNTTIYPPVSSENHPNNPQKDNKPINHSQQFISSFFSPKIKSDNHIHISSIPDFPSHHHPVTSKSLNTDNDSSISDLSNSHKQIILTKEELDTINGNIN